jgi:hypothetical protein
MAYTFSWPKILNSLELMFSEKMAILTVKACFGQCREAGRLSINQLEEDCNEFA